MKKILSYLHRFCLLTPIQRRLLLEASLSLLLAIIIIKLFSFRRLTTYLSCPLRVKEITGIARSILVAEVVAAIDIATKYLPVEIVCFPRAIVAHKMLHDRGIQTTLYYGVARFPYKGLEAHAWVKDEDKNVINCCNIEKYGVLFQL